jgi:hypothetical protein
LALSERCTMTETYCIPNAPKQRGDLWVEVTEDKVKVLNPAGAFWRDKTFTLEEFRKVFMKALG